MGVPGCEEVSSIELFGVGTRYHITVGKNALRHECLFEKKTNDLIVFLPSWNSKRKLLYSTASEFTRNSWNDLPFSTLFVNDPTMHLFLEQRSGWHLGDKQSYALEGMLELVNELRSKNNLDGKLLFYGSSMGGFTALQAASYIKDAIAIAEVPQLDLRKFAPSALLVKRIFGVEEFDAIPQDHVYKLSVIDTFIKNGHIPYFHIMQKESDLLHYHEHLLPFLNQIFHLPLNSSGYHLEIVGGCVDDSGHSAFSKKDAVMRILRLLGEPSYSSCKNGNNLIKLPGQVITACTNYFYCGGGVGNVLRHLVKKILRKIVRGF